MPACIYTQWDACPNQHIYNSSSMMSTLIHNAMNHSMLQHLHLQYHFLWHNTQINKHHNKPSNAFAWHHVKPTESHTCNQNDSNTKTFIQNNSSHDTIVTKSTHIHNIQVKEAHSSHHIPHRTFNSALSKHCIPAHCRHCSHCRHWNSHAKWQNVYYNNMLTPIRTQYSH